MARNESEEVLRKLSSDFIPSSQRSESLFKSVCHSCPPDPKLRKKDTEKLILVSVVCLMFMVAEIVGGILSNSIAISTDAAHLLSDFSAFMVTLSAMWISSKPQTRKMSFGFHRAEVLGALISVLLIWLITGVLVYMAVQRVIYPDYELNAVIMIYVSIGGILANLVMGIILIAFKEENRKTTDKKYSINVKSAIIHVLGDLLQSFGVFIASLIIYFKPELKIVDPICTFLFSVIVLATTFRIMRDILLVLMEGFPKHLDFSEVRKVLFSIPGVVKIHNMRLWSLTMEKVALSAHIVVSKGADQAEILRNATRIISRNLNIYEVTIQIEEIGDPVDTCSVCSLTDL